MKIIQIQGGLGNQLFLYVYWKWLIKTFPNEKIYGLYQSRALAAHNGLEIQKWFDVDMPPTSRMSNLIGSLCFWMNKVFRKFNLPIPYCSDDAHPRPNAFFHDGYFQELVFQETVELPQFKQDLDLTIANKDTLLKLLKPGTVAVHVRRGDFLKDSKNQRTYGGICTLEYYKKAIELVNKEIDNPHFYFFSDDEEYVIKVFNLDNMTVVDFNRGENSFFDMYLMAHASNMILANSTFSCWSAYLNKNVKRVYCPSRWVNTIPNPNLIKKEWCVIR